jgi:LysR family glycine cleavage system transcriptional activator
LTKEGRQFLAEVTTLLDGLASACEHLTVQSGRKLLRVNAPQTFTMRWLIPRLPSFTLAHPDIEVRLAASIAPIEKVSDHYDVAVRRGPLGAGSTPFLAETCVPVASPQLLNSIPVNQVADLNAHTLLHAESVPSLWQRWLDKAGHPSLSGKAQLRFDPLYHSLQAALDGVGIAMGPSALVEAEVAAGRLVPIFPDLALLMDDFHVLVTPVSSQLRYAKLFQRWLVSEGNQ